MFEGEGCISVQYTRGNRKVKTRPAPRLIMCSTDEDVIRRFQAVVGAGSVRGPLKNGGSAHKPHYKPVWSWSWQGLSAAKWVLDNFGPYLGIRRMSKLIEVIDETESAPYASENTRRWALGIVCSTKVCTKCNTEKMRSAFTGRHSWCKECRAEEGRLRRKAQ